MCQSWICISQRYILQPSSKAGSSIYSLCHSYQQKTAPGFFDNYLGLNSVQEMVKNMMKDASIEGKNFTNHILRAPSTTTLFDAGVPEALIQKLSGHHSIKTLRMYERVTPD